MMQNCLQKSILKWSQNKNLLIVYDGYHVKNRKTESDKWLSIEKYHSLEQLEYMFRLNSVDMQELQGYFSIKKSQ